MDYRVVAMIASSAADWDRLPGVFDSLLPDLQSGPAVQKILDYLRHHKSQKPDIPLGRHDGPLHANLDVLRDVIDWNNFAVRPGSCRAIIVAPAADDVLTQSHPFAWSALYLLVYAILSRVKPTRRTAVVVSMRDDGLRILEWIAHYRALGVEGIFIYSNDNADRSEVLLRHLAELGVITFIDSRIDGRASPQRKAFEHSLLKLPELRQYEWVFYADSDEFLTLPSCYDHRVAPVIDAVRERHGFAMPSAICYNWKNFISGNRYESSEEILLKTFNYSVANPLFKSLVRLKDILSFYALHFPLCLPDRFFVNSLLDVVPQSRHMREGTAWDWVEPEYGGGQINHYWCRSFQEFAIKKRRGDLVASSHYRRGFDLFFDWNAPETDDRRDMCAPKFLARVTREHLSLSSLPGVAEAVDEIRRAIPAMMEIYGGDAGLREIYDSYLPKTDAKLTVEIQPGEHTMPVEDVTNRLLVHPDLAGLHYHGFLSLLHETLAPETYFEIGTAQGETLALSRCRSLAVDPNFAFQSMEIVSQVMAKPHLTLVQATSDAFFFAQNDVLRLLGGPIDFAFLDGMHACDFLLRDFINTEQYCDRSSLIVLHDCLPVEPGIAAVVPHSEPVADHHENWWAGDVWRVALLLKRLRPDLEITALDCPPTGLILITNLNPNSTVLRVGYPEYLDLMRSWSLHEIGIQSYFNEMNVGSTDFLTDADTLKAKFSFDR